MTESDHLHKAERDDEHKAEPDHVHKGPSSTSAQRLSRLNIGALFMPGVWGPAHGLWISILFYPLWLFADNIFYGAYSQRTPLAIVLAVIAFVVLTGITIAFAVLGQSWAAERAIKRGIDFETYQRRQRIWAVVCIVIGVAALIGATYYNLVIRPNLGT